jgi:hypothetical protein
MEVSLEQTKDVDLHLVDELGNAALAVTSGLVDTKVDGKDATREHLVTGEIRRGLARLGGDCAVVDERGDDGDDGENSRSEACKVVDAVDAVLAAGVEAGLVGQLERRGTGDASAKGNDNEAGDEIGALTEEPAKGHERVGDGEH